MSYPWPQGPYIPHAPEAPQDAFLWLSCLEALYGGAAGGGKSDALLMAALQYVDEPGYAALLMRHSYTELMLENALLDRAHKWLGHTDASWNGDTMRFTFPSGARLAFGFLKTMADRDRYQSAEFQMIGMDELTKWEESDYRFMYSRLRKLTGVNIPLRMRAATNPGGRGHKWVKDRFIDPYNKHRYNPQRAFIPAKLADNPHIDQESYRQSLAMLEPELVEQLLEGNWEAREPGEWMMRDPRWIDAAAILGAKIWKDHLSGERRLPIPYSITNGGDIPGLTNGIDWGEHTQGYLIWPLVQGGIFVPPCEVVQVSRDPAESTKALIEAAMAFEYPLVQSNYDAAGIQSMRTYLNITRKLPRYRDLRSTGIPFNKYKRECIGYLRTLARRTYQGEFERVLAIHPQNAELIRQLKWWQRKNEETDEAVKEDDHGPDALIACTALIARRYRDYIEQTLIDSYQANDDAYEEGEEYVGN
jgi:hypothetical protein